MDILPDVEDLRLVRALAETGSVGAAARLLQVAQPSASQRLARGRASGGGGAVRARPQGARPTVAGTAFAVQAEHVLGHLEQVFENVRAATDARPLVVGTIPSLAVSVLPVLAETLSVDGVPAEQRVDHGNRLVPWLAEGTLDAVVVAVADQMVLPRGVQVHRLGVDRLVLLLPAGVADLGSGRQPLRDRSVVVATYDDSTETIRRRVAALGGTVVRAATVPTALAMARRATLAAVVPGSTVTHLHDGDRLVEVPWRQRVRLSLLTSRAPDPRLAAVLPQLRERLALTPGDVAVSIG